MKAASQDDRVALHTNTCRKCIDVYTVSQCASPRLYETLCILVPQTYLLVLIITTFRFRSFEKGTRGNFQFGIKKNSNGRIKNLKIELLQQCAVDAVCVLFFIVFFSACGCVRLYSPLVCVAGATLVCVVLVRKWFGEKFCRNP